MAIYRPKTIGDAPEGPERSGGCCWRDFLASRGMGVAQGKKVALTGLRLRRSRRSRSSARSSHRRPRASRAEPQVREKMAAFGSAPQEFETIQRRKRNERRQKAVSST